MQSLCWSTGFAGMSSPSMLQVTPCLMLPCCSQVTYASNTFAPLTVTGHPNRSPSWPTLLDGSLVTETSNLHRSKAHTIQAMTSQTTNHPGLHCSTDQLQLATHQTNHGIPTCMRVTPLQGCKMQALNPNCVQHSPSENVSPGYEENDSLPKPGPPRS